jgi:hypothetical protein
MREQMLRYGLYSLTGDRIKQKVHYAYRGGESVRGIVQKQIAGARQQKPVSY